MTDEQPRCGETFELPFSVGHAICTRAPHLPADPWHQDDHRHGVRWKTLDSVERGEFTAQARAVGAMSESDRQVLAELYVAARERFTVEVLDGGEQP